MSGSGGSVEFTITGDTSSLDAALQQSAQAAQAAFSALGSAAESATGQVTTSLRSLQQQLEATRALMSNVGAGELQQQLQASAAAIQSQIAALQGLTSAQQALAGAITPGTAALQERIGVLSTEAGAVEQSAVNSLSFAAALATQAEAGIAASTVASELSVSTAAFYAGLSELGIRLQSSAVQTEEMAATMGVLGSRVETVSNGALRSMIAELRGLDGAMLSAEASARAFQAEMASANSTLVEWTLSEYAAAEAEGAMRAAMVAQSETVQQTIARMTGMNQEVKSASDSYAVFAKNTSTAAETSTRFASEAAQVEKNVGHAGTATGGFVRELMVMGREIARGDLSRLAGSATILIQKFGQLTTSTLAYVGALAAVALIAVEVVEQLNKVSDAKQAAEAGRAVGGTNITVDEMSRIRSQLAGMRGISTEVSGELANMFGKATGGSYELSTAIMAVAPALTAMSGKTSDTAGTIRMLSEAMANPIQKGREMIESFHDQTQGLVGTTAQLEAFDQAIAKNDVLAARRIQLDVVTEGFRRLKADGIDATKDASDQSAEAYSLAQAQMAGFGESAGAATAMLYFSAEKQKSIMQQLEAARAALNNAAPDRGSAGGDWVRAQEDGLKRVEDALITQGMTHQQFEEARKKASVDYWQGELQGAAAANLTAEQRIAIQRRLMDAQAAALPSGGDGSEKAGWAADLSAQQAAVAAADAKRGASSRQLHDDLLSMEVAYWRGVVQTAGLSDAEVMAANKHLSDAVKEQAEQQVRDREAAARAGEGAAKKSLQEELAALSEQQQAAHGNFAQVEALEQQKLQLIRQALGERSAAYQEELKKEDQLEQQHTQQLVQEVSKQLSRQRELDSTALQTYKSSLDEEVSAQQLTKADEIAMLAGFAAKKFQIEEESLRKYISTLREGTKEFAAAKAVESQLEAQAAQTQQKYLTQEVQAAQKAAKQQQQEMVQAFDKIGSSFQSAISGMITHQMTLKQAAQSVARTMLTEFVDMCTQMLFKWAATQVAKTLIQNQQLTQQVGAQQAAGNSGFSAIASWLAKEVGLQSSTDLTTEAQSNLTAKGEIGAQAAVASAAAYAATAAIPVTGPELAPAAASAAYGEVMGMQGLIAMDVGAWNVPQNMPAYIHQGEMVVPANFASGLRNGLGNMGGVAQTNNMTVSPTINMGGQGPGGMTSAQLMSLLSTAMNGAVNQMVNLTRNGSLQLPGRAA